MDEQEGKEQEGKEQEGKEKLRNYLRQFTIASLRMDKLKQRHDMLVNDLNAPLQGTKYSSMPTCHSAPSGGAASIIYRVAEIEEMISKQHDKMADTCIKIMSILEMLPDESDERLVLELKYIDRMSMKDIEESIFKSLSSCYRIENSGIDKLLEYDRVRELIGVA